MTFSFFERLRRLSPTYMAEQKVAVVDGRYAREKPVEKRLGEAMDSLSDRFAQKCGFNSFRDMQESAWNDYYETPALHKPRARLGRIDGSACWRLTSVMNPNGDQTVVYGRTLAEAYVLFKNRQSAPAGRR